MEFFVSTGTRLGWRGSSLAALTRSGGGEQPIAGTAAFEEAAILFTSGSTGPPKGVCYTHGMFEAQLAALRAMYGLAAGEIDLACFPLFALFDAALGLTTVFPDVPPSRPATCDPAAVHRADLVIVSAGRMGAFHGQAWLPRQLPAGFDPRTLP